MSRKLPRNNTTPFPSPDSLAINPHAFVPYVFITTSRRMPTSIAMAAVAGGNMKTIKLPSAVTAESLPVVQDIVREHYHENEGHCILFGRITGFLFVFTPTEGILLDIEGSEVARKQGKFSPVSISIQDRL
jgi:hypothetical protein